MTRRDWSFFLAVAVISALAAYLIATLPAPAADDETCKTYSVDVERLVESLTNDIDVSQAARDRSFVWCGVIDEPPHIKIEEQGTAPATDKPAKTFQDPWSKACAKRFRSFNADDGTVLLPRHKIRSPCPVPK